MRRVVFMHRIRVIALGLVLSMSFGVQAFAATTTTRGTIEALDAKACVVTLSDKSNYQFGKGCDFSKLKIGEKIAIMWKAKGAVRMAVQVFVAS